MSERYISIVWRQFLRGRVALGALVFVCLLAAVAALAPFIANDRPIVSLGGWELKAPIQFGPGSYDLNSILAPPSAEHPLGTDGDGRDVAAQLVWGARVSLSVGIVAVGLAVLIGVILGAAAGFYGGWVDIVVSRLIEVMICFPTFFLILAVLAFVGPSIYNIMIVIGVTGWTGVARLVRGEFLRLKSREFVTAAAVAGAGDLRVILRHILPNAMAPVLVSATFGVAGAILAESSLSFLGFGVPPSTPSWGSLLSQAMSYMDIAWWLTLAPGLMVFMTVTAFNLVGEGVRDAVDPHMKA